MGQVNRPLLKCEINLLFLRVNWWHFNQNAEAYKMLARAVRLDGHKDLVGLAVRSDGRKELVQTACVGRGKTELLRTGVFGVEAPAIESLTDVALFLQSVSEPIGRSFNKIFCDNWTWRGFHAVCGGAIWR